MSTLDPSMFEGLDVEVSFDAPLGPLTWYRVGGSAEALVDPRSIESLGELLRRCHASKIAVRVLGSGANLLVADEGVPGVIVRLSNPAFRQLKGLDRRDGLIAVGGGYDLMRLVNETTRVGLGGLEGLAGVPASIGGAVRMNAGGAYGQISDVVASVLVMDDRGQTRRIARDDIAFGYRRSGITELVIIEVELQLEPAEAVSLIQRKKEVFARKKYEQPFGAATCGCAFKNPTDDQGQPCDSAGRLIDACGLKGYRLGGAVVSDRHANFIAAESGASADDLIRLIDHVQREVAEQTGVHLVCEVVIWP
ncbi:MAG: UDP-N-acetylmuramate dehydrogenase [Phycisphaeraceae bacterium]